MATLTKMFKNQTRSTPKNLNDEIGKLAYKFFLERSSKHGHDSEDWLRAEKIVKARHGIK